MAKTKSEKSVKLSYEDALDQIEQIVDQIESGQAGLEDTLTQYEKAVKLISHCRTILDRTEKRLAELTPDAAGKLKVTDGDEDDDA